jgi:hypothetical protein
MTFVFALRAAKYSVRPEIKPLPVPHPVDRVCSTILLPPPPRYPSAARHLQIAIRNNGFRIDRGDIAVVRQPYTSAMRSIKYYAEYNVS